MLNWVSLESQKSNMSKLNNSLCVNNFYCLEASMSLQYLSFCGLCCCLSLDLHVWVCLFVCSVSTVVKSRVHLEKWINVNYSSCGSCWSLTVAASGWFCNLCRFFNIIDLTGLYFCTLCLWGLTWRPQKGREAFWDLEHCVQLSDNGITAINYRLLFTDSYSAQQRRQ